MTAPAGILAGLCVVEVSAFIAAPLGGMTLAQLGAGGDMPMSKCGD